MSGPAGRPPRAVRSGRPSASPAGPTAAVVPRVGAALRLVAALRDVRRIVRING
ncbi:hypothetical protein ACWQ06_14940 [Streptomyces angustmyceticus]|uniref:hypothetical protein n=1 Tax=Streptomyces angustmyceticus TaxID=285578 RepID=UPI0021AF799D|nr:hypothetical protein [Streptomyces angustmyceticus]